MDDLNSIRAIASAHPLYQLMIPIVGKYFYVFLDIFHVAFALGFIYKWRHDYV